jgi:hypothetical protein
MATSRCLKALVTAHERRTADPPNDETTRLQISNVQHPTSNFQRSRPVQRDYKTTGLQDNKTGDRRTEDGGFRGQRMPFAVACAHRRFQFFAYFEYFAVSGYQTSNTERRASNFKWTAAEPPDHESRDLCALCVLCGNSTLRVLRVFVGVSAVCSRFGSGAFLEHSALSIANGHAHADALQSRPKRGS